MNPDEDPSDTPDPAKRLLILAAVVLVAVAAVGAWLLGTRPAPPPPASAQPARSAAAATPAPDVTAPAAAAPASSATSAPAKRAARKVKPQPPPPAGPSTPGLLLRVDSDVPGASVFVDRVYVGKTPLATGDVAAGTHVVHVSAEGYESQSNTIEMTSGPNDLMVRFKLVRLDEKIAVVHKHTIGSCEGRLLADPRGLRYDTSNRDHAFTVAFSDLRSFEVDYLKKNLKLTRKDGKTFNFTDRSANADALFVFHEKVEKARAKLAQGWPPAGR